MGITIVFASLGTVVLATLVKLVIGLRPSVEGEQEGLDATDHGESGYHGDELTGHPVGAVVAASAFASAASGAARPEGSA